MTNTTNAITTCPMCRQSEHLTLDGRFFIHLDMSTRLTCRGSGSKP